MFVTVKNFKISLKFERVGSGLLNHDTRQGGKVSSRKKHSSLFVPHVSDKEKRFITLTPYVDCRGREVLLKGKAQYV